MVGNFSNNAKPQNYKVGTLANAKMGPSPAQILVVCPWVNSPVLRPLGQLAGNPQFGYFYLPVTPEKVKYDFGSDTDKNEVIQTGEVVLPKYKNAVGIRFESFFPYDTKAPYVNPRTYNLIDKYQAYKKRITDVADSIRSLKDEGISALLNNQTTHPNSYRLLFEQLNNKKYPITVILDFTGVSISYKVTISTFEWEHENNGDVSYSISLSQWTDISPRRVGDPKSLEKPFTDIESVISQDSTVKSSGNIFNDIKKWYGTITQASISAFCLLNNIKSLAIDLKNEVFIIKHNINRFLGGLPVGSNILGSKKGFTSADTSKLTSLAKLTDMTKQKDAFSSQLLSRKYENMNNF